MGKCEYPPFAWLYYLISCRKCLLNKTSVELCPSETHRYTEHHSLSLGSCWGVAAPAQVCRGLCGSSGPSGTKPSPAMQGHPEVPQNDHGQTQPGVRKSSCCERDCILCSGVIRGTGAQAVWGLPGISDCPVTLQDIIRE